MHGYASILVPVDFSPSSVAAVHHGKLLATTFGAELELMHVWVPPRYVAYDIPMTGSGDEASTLQDAAERFARGELEKLANELELGDDVVRSVRTGPIAKVIVDRAREAETSLICMGTRGYGALDRTVMGSVATRVAQLADCPVLVVHGDDAPAS